MWYSARRLPRKCSNGLACGSGDEPITTIARLGVLLCRSVLSAGRDDWPAVAVAFARQRRRIALLRLRHIAGLNNLQNLWCSVCCCSRNMSERERKREKEISLCFCFSETENWFRKPTGHPPVRAGEVRVDAWPFLRWDPDPEMGPSLAPTAMPMELGACTGYSARRYRQAKAPDYFGYLPFEPNAAHLFFQLVSRRYERGAI